MNMIKPTEITLETLDCGPKTYVISKLPATVGREILVKYIPAIMPKIGDYKVSEEVMFKMMAYVAVKFDDPAIAPLRLTTEALINNHVPDWETLSRLELQMIDYNTSFFRNGKALNFLTAFKGKATTKITETLTDLLASLLPVVKPLLQSFGRSTTSKTRSRSGKQS